MSKDPNTEIVSIEAEKYAAQGLRTLVFAYKRLDSLQSPPSSKHEGSILSPRKVF